MPDRHPHIKQVIVMRRDLKMRQGKAVAQGAHAAMMFMLAYVESIECVPSHIELEWIETGMRKICVRVDSLEELKSIIEQAQRCGLKCFPIIDAGDTEFHGESTMTCCAIGPDEASRIDLITGHLRLL